MQPGSMSRPARIASAVCIFLAGLGATFLYSHLGRFISVARTAEVPHELSYTDFLTITLTALCAILAALAIIIGGAAIWGYSGIKEALTKDVSEKADKALQAKLSEYPDSREMFETLQELKDAHKQQEALHRQLVTENAAKQVAQASKKGDDGAKKRVPLARRYPGKEK